MLLLRPKMPYRSRTSMRPEFLEDITIVMYVNAKLGRLARRWS